MDQVPLHGEVITTTPLTPSIVRVVLGGDGLNSFEATPFSDQYVNALFAPQGAPYEVPFDVEAARAGEHRPIGRRYTVRAWDPAARRLTIDFVVHGDTGVAGRWAYTAAPGDLLQFTGPNGGYSPDPDAPWYLMAGDESALPAIGASLERVRADKSALVLAVVDSPEHELDLQCPGDLQVHWVHRDSGGSSPRFNAALEALEFLPGTPDVFVHGEAAEVRAAKKHLIADRGLDRDSMSVSPYWRRGQTDEAWRAVKKQWLAEAEHDV